MGRWKPVYISAAITLAVCLIVDWLATIYIDNLSTDNYQSVLTLVYNDGPRPGSWVGLISVSGLIYMSRDSKTSKYLVGIVIGAGLGNILAHEIFSKGTPDYISLYPWSGVDVIVNLSDVLMAVMIIPILYYLPRDVARRDKARKQRKLDAAPSL